MSAPAVVRVGRTPSGYRLRVEGRGTMRESPAVFEFAGRAFEDEAVTLVVDLTDCQYLDSTFLGCLVVLHRRHGGGPTPRLMLVTSEVVERRVLIPNNLHAIFRFAPACPEVVGDDQVIPVVVLEPSEMGRHALEAHRRLAECQGRNAQAFHDVADQLERELCRDPLAADR